MIFLWIAGGLVLLFVLFACIGGYSLFRFALARDDRRSGDGWDTGAVDSPLCTEEENARRAAGAQFLRTADRETVYIRSHDDLRLCGSLIEHPHPVGVAVLMHGYRSHPVWDFCGVAEDLYRDGFTLLLPEQRAHGRSEGDYLGFGLLERRDVTAWASSMQHRFPELPLVVYGISMGAATVMLGGTIGYPSHVRAVIADCGYTTPGAICRKVMKQWFHLPPFPVYPCAKAIARRKVGVDLDAVSCAEGLRAMGERGIRVMLAHGRADDFVPYTMGEENRQAMPEPERFVTSETAGHAIMYLRERTAYKKEMEKLFADSGIVIQTGGKEYEPADHDL